MLGSTLLHYRIVEKLGQGGMGVVYKAVDTHLDRFVAIKVLPQDKVADPERKRRFVQEAKAASALNHPNIVTIHDIDEVDGIHFISMEYVAGKTLHEMIKSRELQLNQSLDYAIQIARALSKAHAAGIVHRDLKPSNVMVTSEGLVKVLDFGLAKLMEWPASPTGKEDGSLITTLERSTGEGVILGTLSYMSPEQARGWQVDYRTDIFSLGVVIYQMVAGEPPFSGPHAVAVLDKLLYSPTPSLTAVNPSLPAALEQTVGRATAKDPRDRYQSMQELVYDLRSLSAAPERSASLSNGNQRGKKKRSLGRRLAAVAAALVVLALLLAMPFRGRLPRWLGGTALPEQMRLAILPFNNVGEDTGNQAICDGLMEILATKLNQIERFRSSLNIVPASEVRTEKVTSASGARRVFGANMVLTGSMQKLRDQLIVTINLVDAVSRRQIDGKICKAAAGELLALEEDAFEKAVAMLALKLNPRERQVLSAGETRVPAAYNSYLQGVGSLARFDVTENVEKAIQFFQQAVQEDPHYALAYAGMGEAYWRKFQRTGEREWVDAALSSCTRAAELDDRVVRLHVTLGTIYVGIGQPEKAVDELNRAIGMNPRGSEAYRELGRAYDAMGRIGDAEATYRRAISLKPDSWPCYWNLGVFYYNHARYAQAAAQFQKVIQLAPDHFRAYSSLGGIYAFEGQFGKAAEMFGKSISIKPTPEAYSNLGTLYILQRRFSEAVPLLERAAGMQAANYEVWGNLADAYLKTSGLSSKAPAAYTRAVKLAEDALAVNPKNGSARACMAYYLIRLGDKQRALKEIERAGELAPDNQNVLFWTALVNELAGNREQALKSLAAAAAGGYSLALIRAAFDFDELRKDPRYRDLVEGQSTR